MTEEDTSAEGTPVPESAPRPAAPSRWRRFFAGLLWLLFIAALAGGTAWLYARISAAQAQWNDTLSRLVRDLNAVEAQTDRLETAQSDLAVAQRDDAAAIEGFGARIDRQDDIIGELRDQLAGGRSRLQLATVEQLLLLANDRLQLDRDVHAALVAIESADARLLALRDPRLHAVRAALAEERAALEAVPQPDLAGAVLSLSTLIERAPRLPLAARAPSRFEAARKREKSTAELGWGARVWQAVVEAISSIFTVRRSEGPPPRLLDEEQEALVLQVLTLKLEGARLALLSGDTVNFRDLCESATTWLDLYFRSDDPGVKAARATLDRLQPLELRPPLPEIGGSLQRLREFLKPEAVKAAAGETESNR